ncbi:Histidinol-phosphate aminotransferase [Roseimaritima multifibrata]|uniref:Histidinol-phosphate aminotransferase n=1 Tax=Roseimaritima multifibrata TaxID=1930274 RepID=A0A517MIT9_9BACT|nr:histidinol-phosphate transaminase [Roseimaritima multifibrata]QDS94812.1 Histidinol-phosphate aminotransferase [Roseimaritima multifibrata]
MSVKSNPFRATLAKMHPYVPGEQPQGGKFIKLNTNENPYPAPPAVTAAIISAAQAGLQRYPDPTASSFRRQAAETLGLPGPDWILAGNGSDEILTILVRAMVGEGERLRLPYPSYILYRTLADIQGADWEQTEFDKDWKLPAAFGEASSDGEQKLRLAFLPNPNSPSGTVLTPDEVLEIAERLPCPLVVDEAYADFAETNCLKLVEQNENIFITRTLSKSYALAGLRFGFVIAQPHRIAELGKIKDSYNCDALSIAAATAAVGSSEWLADNVQKIKATRRRMEQKLTEIGFKVTPSQANFVWCQHPHKSHKEMYEQLKKSQILVRYMDFPEWGDGLRISVGTDDQVDACLMLLAQM